jgi:hypothetical protein
VGVVGSEVAGDLIGLAKSIYEDVGNMLDNIKVIFRTKDIQPQEFAVLYREFKNLSAIAYDKQVNADYFTYLTEFFHEERLAVKRKAVMRLALYMDESTDISTSVHMLLCATFVDQDFKFRDELVNIFDVSEQGGTVGSVLEDASFKGYIPL